MPKFVPPSPLPLSSLAAASSSWDVFGADTKTKFSSVSSLSSLTDASSSDGWGDAVGDARPITSSQQMRRGPTFFLFNSAILHTMVEEDSIWSKTSAENPSSRFIFAINLRLLSSFRIFKAFIAKAASPSFRF